MRFLPIPSFYVFIFYKLHCESVENKKKMDEFSVLEFLEDSIDRNIVFELVLHRLVFWLKTIEGNHHYPLMNMLGSSLISCLFSFCVSLFFLHGTALFPFYWLVWPLNLLVYYEGKKKKLLSIYNAQHTLKKV